MAGNKKTGAPIVFISSTIEDLRKHRETAAQAARAAGFLAILSEDWTAKDHPPLEECLQRVDGCHLTIAIAAHRYGWIPDGQKDHKSITRLECERAVSNGQALLPFMVDDDGWPIQKREQYRLTQAALDGEPANKIAALAKEIESNDTALKHFKEWLGDGRIRKTFSENLDTFRSDVKDALRDWLEHHPEFHREAVAQAGSHADPTKYLQDLHKATANIDIRGLAVGSGKAHRFPIGELYIELEGVIAREQSKGGPEQVAGSGALSGALGSSRLVIIGDPGSGKTTFLRWVANTLAGDRLGLTENKGRDRFGLEADYLPLFISIADWLTHIGNARANGPCPTTDRDAAWLPHYLATRAASLEQRLDAGGFRALLKDGKALVLLDGLDEAADRKARERAVELIEAVATAWPKAPLVVTSRPVAYRDRSVLPGFETARIEPLSDAAVETFLTRWSQALHPGDAPAAREHQAELAQALGARPNIRRLARNTVMLTALAVVHWNEKRLPEQRAELYESILTWLARSRELRPGRPGPERSLEVLRALALTMQDADGGRKIQIPRREAAEKVAGLFGGDVNEAERFLEEEELDSGILVRWGNEVRFWHLTFQEYLAARAVAGLGESAQQELLLGAKRRFHAPEWKEVVLLLAGVLYEQGRGKVDGLVSQVLDDLHAGGAPGLPERARVFGLLGALVRDLSPFDYRPTDGRYLVLRDSVMGIFERERAGAIRVEDRIAAAEALGQAGDPRLADEGQRWVEIPGGRFLMGAQNVDRSAPGFDQQTYLDESPPHWVEVDDIKLGRWPVTVLEYGRFIEDGGYHNAYWWEKGLIVRWTEPGEWNKQSGFPNYPVTGVSWFEATAYCVWLTEKWKRSGRLSSRFVIRLPTEAEWEWAARRESKRNYPWGTENASSERLNYKHNIGRPTPIGVYPMGATPDGMLDLSGNVWEWCFDWKGDD